MPSVRNGCRQRRSARADEVVTEWLNEGLLQACVRGRLLLEDANPAMCEIAIEAGQHTYRLHPKVYELVVARFKADGHSEATPLKVVSRGWLDSNVRDWRDAAQWQHMGVKRYLVQNETSIRIVPTPAQDGLLTIEAYRLPRSPMVDESDAPEIHEASHLMLVDWALYRAFSAPDADAFDPQRAKLSEDSFTDYFGLPVDADLRRITREDTPQTNKVYL